MKKLLLLVTAISTGILVQAQDFNILAQGIGRRGMVTHTISSGDFTVGINRYGGGYITRVDIPGIGNVVGNQAARYGRGGQSSIRDQARGGQYNPTQAGYSDEAGTIVTIVEEASGKLIVPKRGCVLFNGDGKYDYTEWENITKDPVIFNDGGNSDQDGVDESSLSITIDGRGYNMQRAEVYSDFDFYGEYEDFSPIAGLSTPAIRHYFEYHFIRSSTNTNATIKQFNKTALEAANLWESNLLSNDISVNQPTGVFPGGEQHLNEVQLTWSLRNDVADWDPEYRHVQLNNGSWIIQNRTNPSTGSDVLRGDTTQYKIRLIISDSNDDNTGEALGFYLPVSEINTNNIVGVKESDNSRVYVDNRTTFSEFRDNRTRIPSMGLMAFRSRLNGLIDRSLLIGQYEGVYEMLRSENILLQGTPGEIKAAFTQLDTYYANLLSVSNLESPKQDAFQLFPNPANDYINIVLNKNNTNSKINIFNTLGALVYSLKGIDTEISIPTSQIGAKGLYLIKIGGTTKKLILK